MNFKRNRKRKYRKNVRRWRRYWKSILNSFHYIFFEKKINEKYLAESKQRYFDLMVKSGRHLDI